MPDRTPESCTNSIAFSRNSFREVLCYPCALRMSFLYHLPPPLTMSQLLEQSKQGRFPSFSFSSDSPVVDTESHPRFFIVHETEKSVKRCFRNAHHTDGLRDSPLVKVTISGDAKSGESLAQISWVCIACAGLYQFMDLVYAPLLSAAVRRSPFFDSQNISVNASVHRSFTFIWLAASTRYFDSTSNWGSPEDTHAKPPERSIVPEEWSSFKDFFVSDLRARVMAYLRQSYKACMTNAHNRDIRGRTSYFSALGIKEKDETATSTGFSQKESEENEVLQPLKKARIEEANSTIVKENPASYPTSQAFLYSGENKGVVLEVNCMHRFTEGVVAHSGMPSELCANRTESVLSYGVLYEYACPYLQKIGWAGPRTFGWKGCCSEAANSSSESITAPRMEVATMNCDISHVNIFLLGNYRKMTRNLSQSPWFSSGKRVGSFSLQEVIAAPLLRFFFPEGVRPVVQADKLLATAQSDATKCPDGGFSGRTDGSAGKSSALLNTIHPSIIAAEHVYGFGRYKFHSAGREDVDVRMLGKGRPFVLEVVSPSREQVSTGDLEMLTKAINDYGEGCVEINRLRVTDSTVTQRLARHSESKIKCYRCVVWTSRSIPSLSQDPLVQEVKDMRDVLIEQKTPLRVLHRRSLHTRKRVVHSMRFEPINDHWFLFDIVTQAGTYIKEFIHGDLGRTLPNLGTLLHSRMDILQLDVVDMIGNEIDE